MTIAEMQERCYEQAKLKGWTLQEVPIPEQVALIHSEASEALECYRNDEPFSYTGEDGKPLGIASEYADILIRVAHYSQLLGIDLEAEVVRKLDYNLTRSHRHGGKRI
jgi:NTP pyrophosphatase (non-canonical NTP hydrolase)